ncbi:MAG: hypothetical protein GTN64_08775, partial [Candidatus Latescibacteria bacterium]|nr:hypothetical protein [Candidatus Latescibacterota bacterium]NIO78692.1 hypothetical protein [Candidatus Latescibacterota bacterium]
MDARLSLRFHYSSKEIDWLARMDEDASTEDFLEYYRQMIAIEADRDITSLTVKAFERETAREIAKAVIELSEQLVNRLSERIVNDTLRFARQEFSLAEDRVRKSSSAVTDFRKQTQLIDPTLETSSVLSIVTGLETQLAEARTELLEAESYMQPKSAR